jgi:hypothetical protein
MLLRITVRLVLAGESFAPPGALPGPRGGAAAAPRGR